MKKYILLFFLLSLLPCLSTACSDDDGSSTPNLTVGKETVDFNSESGSQNVLPMWISGPSNQIKIGATRLQTGRH